MKTRRKPLTKIQKFAKGKPCSLRIPSVCRETPENEDVVLAHAPYPGRHGSRKDDFWGCPACSKCHDEVDGRTGWKECTWVINWYPAIHEWQAMLIKEGLMTVGGVG